jgi:hypothetical protein
MIKKDLDCTRIIICLATLLQFIKITFTSRILSYKIFRLTTYLISAHTTTHHQKERSIINYKKIRIYWPQKTKLTFEIFNNFIKLIAFF